MIYRQPPAAIPAIWVARKSADTGFAGGGCVAPEANIRGQWTDQKYSIWGAIFEWTLPWIEVIIIRLPEGLGWEGLGMRGERGVCFQTRWLALSASIDDKHNLTVLHEKQHGRRINIEPVQIVISLSILTFKRSFGAIHNLNFVQILQSYWFFAPRLLCVCPVSDILHQGCCLKCLKCLKCQASYHLGDWAPAQSWAPKVWSPKFSTLRSNLGPKAGQGLVNVNGCNSSLFYLIKIFSNRVTIIKFS